MVKKAVPARTLRLRGAHSTSELALAGSDELSNLDGLVSRPLTFGLSAPPNASDYTNLRKDVNAFL
jgi:hypothetical protein